MRTVLLAVGLLALVPGFGRADDVPAVVEKAVRAMAGSDLRLNRLQTVVRSDRGTLNLPVVGEVPVQRTAFLNPPERIKYDAMLTVGGQRQAMILTLNGVKGWQLAGGGVKDLTPAEYDVMQDEAYIWSLVTLLPLKQKGVTVTALQPQTINKKPAAVVNVARPGRADAQMYFDADTGLPVKVKVKVREAGLEVGREVDLDGYRDFDGIKLPTRITVTQNGKKIEDWTVQRYGYPDRLEDKVFAKP